MKKCLLIMFSAGFLPFMAASCKNTTGPSIKPLPENEIKYKIIIGVIANGGEDSVTADLPEAYKGETVAVKAEMSVNISGTEHNLLWLKANNETLSLTVQEAKYIAEFEMPASHVVITGIYSNTALLDIETILSLMPVEQKIRQMVQAEQPVTSSTDRNNPSSLSNQWYGSVISSVGETPVPGEGGNTPHGWVSMANNYMAHSLNPNLITVNVTGEGSGGNGVYFPVIPIPYIHGIDAVHGMTHMPNTTVLPHAIGLGAIAAGNLGKGQNAVYDSGRITAQETKALGLKWTFAPVLGNIENVRWGRSYESWTENLDLAISLVPSAIKGFQDQGVAACAKHFYGEGQSNYRQYNGENRQYYLSLWLGVKEKRGLDTPLSNIFT